MTVDEDEIPEQGVFRDGIWVPEVREVEKEKCVCENGVASFSDLCDSGAECLSCNDGYHLVDDSCHKDTIMYKIKEYLMNILGYVGPLLILFVLYYFRKYYKTHNNIYMFVSIFIVLYVLLYYIIFFELPMKFLSTSAELTQKVEL